jgi:hypothetical protein
MQEAIYGARGQAQEWLSSAVPKLYEIDYPGPIELNRSGFEHAMSKHGTSIVHAPGFTLQVLEPGERQHQNVLESETIR